MDDDELEIDHGWCEQCGEILTESPDDCTECGWSYEDTQDPDEYHDRCVDMEVLDG